MRRLKRTVLPRGGEKVPPAEGWRQGHKPLPRGAGDPNGRQAELVLDAPRASRRSSGQTPALTRRRERTRSAGSRGREPRAPRRVSGAASGSRGAPRGPWVASARHPAGYPAEGGRGRGVAPQLSSRVAVPALPSRLRTPGLGPRGAGAGRRAADGDRCARRPMARRAPLLGPPPRAPIGGRAALQVRAGARVPRTAPAASARRPGTRGEFVRARVSAAPGGALAEEAPDMVALG